MANNVLLISDTRLRNLTDLGYNYNERDTANAIRAAQEDLRDIIGVNLFERYQTDIQAGTTLPDDYTNLLNNRIQPYLLHRSYWYMLETIYITPRSNGLGQRNTGPSFTAADQSVYYQKRKSAESKINDAADKLREYLNRLGSMFTELTADTDIDSDAPDLDGANSLPIVNKDRLRLRNRRRNYYGY